MSATDEWGKPELPTPPADKGEMVTWFNGAIGAAIPGRSRQGLPTVTLVIDEADVWKMMLAKNAVGLMLHIELWAPEQPETDEDLVALLGLEV